jgi:hypothetical protein
MMAEIRHRFTMVSDSVQLWKKPTNSSRAAMPANMEILRQLMVIATCPLKMPVGRTSSTITRMMKETANL